MLEVFAGFCIYAVGLLIADMYVAHQRLKSIAGMNWEPEGGRDSSFKKPFETLS